MVNVNVFDIRTRTRTRIVYCIHKIGANNRNNIIPYFGPYPYTYKILSIFHCNKKGGRGENILGNIVGKKGGPGGGVLQNNVQ